VRKREREDQMLEREGKGEKNNKERNEAKSGLTKLDKRTPSL
jgi:hypothetical protein